MSVGIDFPGYVAQLVYDGWPVELATSAGLDAYRSNLQLFEAIADLIRAAGQFSSGAILVAAAGNESLRSSVPAYSVAAALPASSRGFLSVGATQQQDESLTVAPFSNTWPDVVAPGVDIASARIGGGLCQMSGTSMATPHAAGLAALWWEALADQGLQPTARNASRKLIGSARADRLAPSVGEDLRGHGLLTAP
jgi:subtilisin family serine protease